MFQCKHRYASIFQMMCLQFWFWKNGNIKYMSWGEIQFLQELNLPLYISVIAHLNDLLSFRAISWVKHSLLLPLQLWPWNPNQGNWKKSLLLKFQLIVSHCSQCLHSLYRINVYLSYGFRERTQRSFWRQ